ncbi:hypothetical protein JMJ77_0000811 [Colletotrichum scovillei]|uniref:Uncharacterized protein n=1 Tax=Colletotrichum scovillei TaxID=1209932 RepID=A0A9P7RBS9_9PEZI|nr:hypothetical protein JMJ77_0000811 [Colletotrichum scovillei]KAG7072024.1 hypothetical protein JMJ76_0004887 [Colletotrichum scovillei]KAG7080207.1 hypothetical protein JMJ78_0007307 [Colletotrichum scovillei]
MCLGPKWRAPTKLLASHSNPNIATQKSLSNISVLNKSLLILICSSHHPPLPDLTSEHPRTRRHLSNLPPDNPHKLGKLRKLA